MRLVTFLRTSPYLALFSEATFLNSVFSFTVIQIINAVLDQIAFQIIISVWTTSPSCLYLLALLPDPNASNDLRLIIPRVPQPSVGNEVQVLDFSV